MHEATRRLLGVLLRQLDGFGPQSKSIVVGATNRRQDLDPALLSRFDAAVTFGLPSEPNRCALAHHAYACTWHISRSLACAGVVTCMLEAHANPALINSRKDLDPALLSSLDAAVTFGLPSAADRCTLACRASAGTWHTSGALAGAGMVACMLKVHADTALLSCTSYS